MPDSAPPSDRPKVLWLARLEYRFHAWRAKRARRRGLRPIVTPFPGYGGADWVRVLGRVLIPPKAARRSGGEFAGVRGWRSFVAVPVGFAEVHVEIDGETHTVRADRGGVVDVVLPATLPSGWRDVRMSVENGPASETRVYVVGAEVRHGVVSDVDDTVMVTALPRPLLAAWNSFVLDEHARQPVPGMAVLLERVVREWPGAPVVYLSTGAWNIAPTLMRFLHRHLFPTGAILLTDWGPTHDRWFRSGKAHKLTNLRRLAEQFPHVRWLLIGDDGQHDDEIYTTFTNENPDSVTAVAIRRLSPTQAVLAGGRTLVDDHSETAVPWVSDSDGAGLFDRLVDAGVVGRGVGDRT